MAQNAFKKFLSLKPPTLLQDSLQKIQNPYTNNVNVQNPYTNNGNGNFSDSYAAKSSGLKLLSPPMSHSQQQPQNSSSSILGMIDQVESKKRPVQADS